jgi:hypothetical protein
LTFESYRRRPSPAWLSEGADGFFYRHSWSGAEAAGPGLNAALVAANREVARLAPWLAVGGVRGTATVEGDPASMAAHTRSAGDRGALVFLTRGDAGARGGGASGEGGGAAAPPTVRVFVPLPAWAAPSGVSFATPEALTPLEMARTGEGVSFAVPVPGGASAYVVHFGEAERRAAEGRAGP